MTRYVPREQVPAVQQAIEGYKHFQALTEQYADEVITEPPSRRALKKALSPQILLAREQEIEQFIARFQASTPDGVDVQSLEVLVRTAMRSNRRRRWSGFGAGRVSTADRS